MIKHIVMFKLKAAENKAEILEAAKSKLQNFEKEIPTLKKLEVVFNAKGASNGNYDLALICDFADMDGLDEYQKHPTHLAFVEFIGEVRESRACIDYEY